MIRSILVVLWTLAAFVLFYLTLPGLYAAMKINHDVMGHFAWLVLPLICLRLAVFEFEQGGRRRD